MRANSVSGEMVQAFGWTIRSPAILAKEDQVLSFFGAAVGTARDVNGDGYAERIVGAPDFDHGQDNEGLAFVYRGRAAR